MRPIPPQTIASDLSNEATVGWAHAACVTNKLV